MNSTKAQYLHAMDIPIWVRRDVAVQLNDSVATVEPEQVVEEGTAVELESTLHFNFVSKGRVCAICVIEDEAALLDNEMALLQKMFAAIGLQIKPSDSMQSSLPIIMVGDDLPHPRAILGDPSLKREAWSVLKQFSTKL